jgi:prophage maintenance system killer protein
LTRAEASTSALFLAINDRELEAPEPEVVDVMNRLASGRITEPEFADWLRDHIQRR